LDTEHIRELFEHFRPVEVRRMFGGALQPGGSAQTVRGYARCPSQPFQSARSNRTLMRGLDPCINQNSILEWIAGIGKRSGAVFTDSYARR